jgi:predicted permease
VRVHLHECFKTASSAWDETWPPEAPRYAADVLLQLVLLAAFAGLGIAAQRYASSSLRTLVWLGFYWVVSPILVLHTFLAVHVDRTLLLALAAAVVGAWAAAGLAYLYAHLVADRRDERGALALGAGFGNTGFVGIPLAQLAFGHPGVALAVLYDRLAYLVPASSVTVAMARVHGLRSSVGSRRTRVRALLLNPPLLAALVAVGLRIADVGVPGSAPAGAAAASLVGPAGFLLLGLSLPLERFEHEAQEVGRAAGALVVRFVGGPLCLLAAATALGVHVPGVFYLLSAMPSAFHLLVLARVYDVRPRLMRLLVIGSTVPAVACVALVSAVVR